MKDELKALEDNHTWDLVPKLPNMNVIGTKWIFKVKSKANNSVDKLKARLVAEGYNQQEGIDFSETFSPVVKQAIVRTVLSIVAVRGWFIHQMNETVFVSQPPGFKHSQFPSYVCKLQKALYGLKQAPRAWYDRFSTFLFEQVWLIRLSVLIANSEIVILLLYVDDMLMIGTSSIRMDLFLNRLKHEFSMTDLGQVHYFLGV